MSRTVVMNSETLIGLPWRR